MEFDEFFDRIFQENTYYWLWAAQGKEKRVLALPVVLPGCPGVPQERPKGGKGKSEGHVLRDATSRGLHGRV